jgi:hypothetical protein
VTGSSRLALGVGCCLLAGLLAGCDGSGSRASVGGSGAGATTVSTPATTTQPTAGGKPTPPLEVNILLDGRRIVPRTPFGANVSWTPLVAAVAARTRVEVTGPLTVQGGAGQWNAVPAGRALAVAARITVTGDGAGEVRATAELLDAGGAVLFGRTTVLYVLATGADVLTGTTGTLDLRVRQLDADRAAGRVTADEYARLLERILGGGAVETRD